MNDVTESVRRQMQADLNNNAGDRATLEQRYGQVWDTTQLIQEFIIESFFAPLVIVTRKSDGKRGSLEFQHSPRFYFSFVLD